MTELPAQIEVLSEDDAVAVLALTLDQQGQRADPFAWREVEPRVREALAQPELAPLAVPAAEANAGDAARAALLYLASEEETRPLVERALTVPARADRFDPATLAIGALVLMAFHADIELNRDPERGWSFRFAAKPLDDSVIGKALGQLIGLYTGGPG